MWFLWPENLDSNNNSSPVIRTHPITGYKSLFVNKGWVYAVYSCPLTALTCFPHLRFTKRIVELHPEESANLLDYLYRHISENHDLQVRFRWEKDSVAIWDNRATFHTATYVSLPSRSRR